MIVYLNGQYLPEHEAKISVADRGFLFGDGIYEVIRVVRGILFMASEHLERLSESLSHVEIHPVTFGHQPGQPGQTNQSGQTNQPGQTNQLAPSEFHHYLFGVMEELIRLNNLQEGEAAIYIQITRGGVFPRTHHFPEEPVTPTIYLSASSFTPNTELHQTGTNAITFADQRWSQCHIKSVNLLPNVLAKQKAREAGVNNVVMIRNGLVTESANTNIFGVMDGVLYTHPDDETILSGVTRLAVFELADELGIEVRREAIREEELPKLEELFFTGTTTDLLPVVELDGNPVGEGIPGPVCRALQEAYYRKMQRECTGNLQKDYQSDLQSDLQTDPQGTLPGNDSFQSE
ncbi:MAG: D-amino-acid transaminase [Bacteroidetes bacterium]|nr:MAG: D-amino-acid transaminase [Bacteroidota bacterium]